MISSIDTLHSFIIYTNIHSASSVRQVVAQHFRGSEERDADRPLRPVMMGTHTVPQDPSSQKRSGWHPSQVLMRALTSLGPGAKQGHWLQAEAAVRAKAGKMDLAVHARVEEENVADEGEEEKDASIISTSTSLWRYQGARVINSRVSRCLNRTDQRGFFKKEYRKQKELSLTGRDLHAKQNKGPNMAGPAPPAPFMPHEPPETDVATPHVPQSQGTRAAAGHSSSLPDARPISPTPVT